MTRKLEDILKHLTSRAAETYFASPRTKRSPHHLLSPPEIMTCHDGKSWTSYQKRHSCHTVRSAHRPLSPKFSHNQISYSISFCCCFATSFLIVIVSSLAKSSIPCSLFKFIFNSRFSLCSSISYNGFLTIFGPN